jgi:hypothetical protein
VSVALPGNSAFLVGVAGAECGDPSPVSTFKNIFITISAASLMSAFSSAQAGAIATITFLAIMSLLKYFTQFL